MYHVILGIQYLKVKIVEKIKQLNLYLLLKGFK